MTTTDTPDLLTQLANIRTLLEQQQLSAQAVQALLTRSHTLSITYLLAQEATTWEDFDGNGQIFTQDFILDLPKDRLPPALRGAMTPFYATAAADTFLDDAPPRWTWAQYDESLAAVPDLQAAAQQLIFKTNTWFDLPTLKLEA